MKYLKLFFRLLLGVFMTYAGFSHLTIARQEFVAQGCLTGSFLCTYLPW